MICREVSRLGSQLGNQGERSIETIPETASELKSDFNRLSRVIANELAKAASLVSPVDSTRNAQLQRFRDDSIQTRREWDRQWNQVESVLRRAELFKSKASQPSELPDSQAETLLHERSALIQSMGMIDSALDSAVAADAMIREQNASLTSFTSRLGALTAKVPFIQSLLGRINNRQFQERIILGLVIGACISIFLWMRVLT